MAKVAIPIDQIRNGQAPVVCIVCGEHSTHFHFPEVVRAQPPTAAQWPLSPLLSLLGFWWMIFRASFGEPAHKAGIPFCERHRGYWSWRARFIIGGFLGFLTFFGLAIAFPNQTQASPLAGMILALWFFIFLPTFLVLHLSSIRPIERNEDAVVFSSAHRDFVEALERLKFEQRSESPAWELAQDAARGAGASQSGSRFSPVSLLAIALIFLGSVLFYSLRPGDKQKPFAGAETAHARAAQALPISVATPAASPPVATKRADGSFVSAPNRVDMVHDPKRNLLYITSEDSVLRYDLGARIFLSPLVLGGKLLGVDISPDHDALAVADDSTADHQIWIHLVSLTNGTGARISFPAETQERGTYCVAFGADGAIWITSSLNGSGWVPLRKFNPATRSVAQLERVSQDTMLRSSANRQTIAFAQAGTSPGRFGQFNCRASRLPQCQQLPVFLFEIAVDRLGSQVAVPAHSEVALSGSAVPSLAQADAIGVVYHPARDFMFVARSGASTISGFETGGYQKVKDLDFGYQFKNVGARAFKEGRLRMSGDGALLFCTVGGGVRYAETGL